MLKGRHKRAFNSLARLRWTKVQAARDLFYMHTLLKVEAELNRKSGSKIVEFFTIGRNRRAMIGSEIVMFMQQVCRFTDDSSYLPKLTVATVLWSQCHRILLFSHL